MMSKTEKLKELYKKANGYNEEIPAQLIDKMTVYGQIYELIGGLYGDALDRYGVAEVERKDTIANAIVYRPSVDGQEPPTSDKRAEAIGIILAKDKFIAEKKAESEALRWKSARDAVNEQIQIMKKRYEHFVNVAKGGI
jgi:hypothetical protein